MVFGNALGRLRRGMYPLLVKVVLVAVVIVLSIAAVVYVYSLVAITREHFEIKPLLYITYTSLGPKPSIRLYVINGGTKSEVIAKIEIVTGGGSYVCYPEPNIVVEPGFRGYILIGSREEGAKSFDCMWIKQGSPSITEGDFYTIKIYTAHHGVMTILLPAQPG